MLKDYRYILFTAVSFLIGFFLHELHVPYNTSFTTYERSMAKFGRNEGDIDERTTDVPYLR